MSLQSQILKMADGAQVLLGERSSNAFLNVSLRAKDPEFVIRMQQAMQGLVGLLSLSQPDNASMQLLLDSTKVSAGDVVVTLSAEYPAERAVAEIRSEHEKPHLKRHRARKDKDSNSKRNDN